MSVETMAYGATARWEALLSDLEADVERIEALIVEDAPADLVEPGQPWEAPADMPQLPPALAARAEALRARQQRAAQELTALLVSNRRHSTAAAGYISGSPAVPLYWDHSV